MATSTRESIEYQALARCFAKLTIAFKASTLLISNELYSTGIISREEHGKLLTVGVSDEMKATEMVKSVVDLVLVCPGKYYDFMSLPAFKEECFRPLHEEITAVYGECICNYLRLQLDFRPILHNLQSH